MARIIKSTDPRRGSCLPYERTTLVPPEDLVVEEPEPDEAAEEQEPIPEIDPAQLIADARAEAERMIRDGYAEGLRRGKEAGRAEFLEAVGQAAQSLTSAGQVLIQAREAFLSALEPQVVSLAHAIAARILRREAQVNPEVVQMTVRAALGNLIDREQVTLRVNPHDLDVLRAEQAVLLDEFDGTKQLVIVPDASVDTGGCIADTASMHVDATLNAQLERILDALMD